MIASYHSCENLDDGLNGAYANLAIGIIQQAVIDYCHALEGVLALSTPPSERTPKMQRKVNGLRNKGAYTESFALGLQKSQCRHLENFFGSPQYYILTQLPPEVCIKAATEEAHAWYTDAIKRGRQKTAYRSSIRKRRKKGHKSPHGENTDS